MLQELIQSFLVEFVILIVGMILGSFLEDKFDFIGRGRRNRKLKRSIEIALACVFEAEQEIGGGRGREKLDYAIKRYQEETGSHDYEKTFRTIMDAFSISSLSKQE